jgi:hypothetical protein
MEEVARRRAAHFARFNAEEDGEEDEGEGAAAGGANNVHVGGKDARTLGPWSSAAELAEKRADAAAARKERLERQAEEEASRVIVFCVIFDCLVSNGLRNKQSFLHFSF